MDNNAETDERLLKAYEKSLNEHGYGFQYSVLRRSEDLHKSNNSQFIFEVAEFPVEVNGTNTKIDFILARYPYNYTNKLNPLLLIGECKRVNPSLSNWCFIKAPYTRRNNISDSLIIESGVIDQNSNIKMDTVFEQLSHGRFFHIAIETRSYEKGDAQGKGRGAIEEACTQLLRGLNGFVNFMKDNVQTFEPLSKIHLLPVLFTTAKLWGSDADLSNSELETGKINLSSSNFVSYDWLFLQYHQSPALKHSVSQLEFPTELGDILEQEYVRSIAIVSVSGIDTFLRWASTDAIF